MGNQQQLLTSVSLIGKHYREMERLSGESFNLFKLIGVENNELKHSMILADLLNPKGSHGQGSIFLELFTTQLSVFHFHCDHAFVKVEKNIGKRTEEDGGRLDIYISDQHGNDIIIENKIYAGDQENQLIRYASTGANYIYYLTLDGHDASKLSTKNESTQLKNGEHYHLLSYKSDILLWLDKCRKEAAHLPLLREGISHYINLLKYITGQSISKAMNNELRDLSILNPQNLQAAADISASFSNAKHQIQWIFWEALRKALEKKGIQLEDNKVNTVTSQRTWNYYYGKDKLYGLWTEIYKNDEISLHWGCEVDHKIYFGFTIEQNGKGGISNKEEFQEFRDIVKSSDSLYQTTDYWLGWQYSTPQLDFKTFDSNAIYSLADSQTLEAIVEAISMKAVNDIKYVKIEIEKSSTGL